jgi:predicted ATPase
MLTLIEINGFKTFENFKIELAPFQVIVGPNGSGKSNLFDALQLLSRLAEMDLYSAFQGLRGTIDEAFTKYPDGQTSDKIEIVVEMLVDHKIRDDLGREFEIEYTRMRYELEIVQEINENEVDSLHVKKELLRTIATVDDQWLRKYANKQYVDSLGEKLVSNSVIISFEQIDDKSANLETSYTLSEPLDIAEDQARAEKLINRGNNFIGALSRTVLSSTAASTQQAIAARTELSSLKLLHLSPDALRQYCSTKAPSTLYPDGSNLPAVLARMQKEDKYVLGDISRDMVNLVPGIQKIRVERNKLSNQYVIQAKTADQRYFSSQVLSDGNLRLLALAMLKYDGQFHGVLCLEEPENGVDPLHLPNMAHLLRSIATDFDDSDQLDKPLRQVLITTHSPAFISLSEVIDSLIFALKVARVGPGKSPLNVTRMVPIPTSTISSEEKDDIAIEKYTMNQVRKYLDGTSFDKARNRLVERRDER